MEPAFSNLSNSKAGVINGINEIPVKVDTFWYPDHRLDLSYTIITRDLRHMCMHKHVWIKMWLSGVLFHFGELQLQLSQRKKDSCVSQWLTRSEFLPVHTHIVEICVKHYMHSSNNLSEAWLLSHQWCKESKHYANNSPLLSCWLLLFCCVVPDVVAVWTRLTGAL